jgi:two-component system, response regulator FlrC
MSETERPPHPGLPCLGPAVPVLWHDSCQPLTQPALLALREAGLDIRAWSGQPHRPVPAGTAALVVRLLGDLAPLEDALAVAALQSPPVPVLVRVPAHAMALAVAALQQGAAHVLPADCFAVADWQAALRLIRRRPTGAGAAGGAAAERSVVFIDPLSQQLLALARRVARTEMTALVLGPTGAGKEVLARVLHEASERHAGPFVAINCGALPESLIEDTLFGHERGAFSGALREHRGAFEQAHGGTLFLDEIGEMPLAMQVRLLRVLQDRSVQRLGAQRPLQVDVRIVAATHVDLRQAVREGRFREDLYFRISTFALTVPPLSRRPGDILPLVGHALARHSRSARRYRLSDAARQRLLDHPWPGNVRELDNVVQRALVLTPDDLIDTDHLLFDGDEPHAHLFAIPAGGTSPASPSSPIDDPWPAAPAGESAWAPADSPLPAAVSATPEGANASPAPFAPPAPYGMPGLDTPHEAGAAAGLADQVRRQEQLAILAALRSTPSREAAARRLGISPRTLRYKLAQLREVGLALAEV